eukprot:GHVO01025850.1.p1 GENE.GHVO01025850.1~~GHVO01025850.1.p1  ORF type:complete len:106 (-),score=5.97 GHVO01025850.1:57-374(-)
MLLSSAESLIIDSDDEAVADEDEPVQLVQDSVADSDEAVLLASELFDCVGSTEGIERACHCKCEYGPDSSRCMSQFSDQDIQDLRLVYPLCLTSHTHVLFRYLTD